MSSIFDWGDESGSKNSESKTIIFELVGSAEYNSVT